MSDFKAKMHKIQFPLGLHSRALTLLGELTALPDTLAAFLLQREAGEGERPAPKYFGLHYITLVLIVC